MRIEGRADSKQRKSQYRMKRAQRSPMWEAQKEPDDHTPKVSIFLLWKIWVLCNLFPLGSYQISRLHYIQSIVGHLQLLPQPNTKEPLNFYDLLNCNLEEQKTAEQRTRKLGWGCKWKYERGQEREGCWLRQQLGTCTSGRLRPEF